jgi:hypothetical protein
MVDDRNGHAIGVGAGHDAAHFGVDRGAVGYGLCASRNGKAETSKKRSEQRKSSFQRSQGESFPDWMLPDDALMKLCAPKPE